MFDRRLFLRSGAFVVSAAVLVATVAVTSEIGPFAAAETGPAPAASIGADGLGDPYFPRDGNGGYNVASYDAKIHLDPVTPSSFTGDVTVKATATQDLDRFNLDLQGFTVASVEINGAPAKAIERVEPHELMITPPQRITKGAEFAARVRYSGPPTGEGWHRLDGGGVSASGEPHSATAWLPVNDHPSDKAELHLEATVPAAWTVVSNGLPGPTTEGNGEKTYRWADDKPMATYLMTIAVDKFTMRTSALADGTPAIYAYGTGHDVTPGLEAGAKEIVQYLTTKFGKYPFSSAGGIMVSPDSDGVGSVALETQTRPTYTTGMHDVAVIHEMAHMWFGNNVSFSDWRDGCLAECFAQYANWLLNEKDGADLDNQYRDELAREKDNPEFWKVTIYAPANDPLDGAVYFRGSMMVHALRRLAGDDKFWAMLQKWNVVHAYGNASLPDFERFAADQLGTDLTGFFKAWAHSSVIPPDEYLYPGPLKPAAQVGR